MQRVVMAKHVQVGDELFVEGTKVLVTKVKQYPAQRKVLVITDQVQVIRTYDETVYRFETVPDTVREDFVWYKMPATKIT